MATYKGREVHIVKEIPDTLTPERVQIQHISDPSLGHEIVSFTALQLNEDEKKHFANRKTAELKDKIDSIPVENAKIKEAKQKDFASKMPAYDKDKVYSVGDIVKASNGRAYKSSKDDNLANVPADNSAYWDKVVVA